jgi:hypothetical protein
VGGFKLIEVERTRFSIPLMCRMLGVYCGDYYVASSTTPETAGSEAAREPTRWEVTRVTTSLMPVMALATNGSSVVLVPTRST